MSSQKLVEDVSDNDQQLDRRRSSRLNKERENNSPANVVFDDNSNLDLQHLREQGFYSLNDISNALAMQKEEKTMARILSEIRKVHKNIHENPIRFGKKFLYTYHLDLPPRLGQSLNEDSFNMIKQVIKDNYSDVISTQNSDQ